MRIGFNAVQLERGSYADVAFARRILPALSHLEARAQWVVFTGPSGEDAFPGFEQIPIPEATRSRRSSHIVRALTRATEQADLDALLSPAACAPVLGRIPRVLVVMDLRRLESNLKPKRWLYRAKRRRMLDDAVSIVGPTQYVRRHLLEQMEVPMDRVVVAPLGVDHLPAEPQPCPVEKPYLLVTGRTSFSENLDGLMAAFRRLESRLPHTLVIVGEEGDAEPAEWGPRILRIQRCPMANLAALYQHADLTLFPEVEDCAGLGVLEAMRAGARIVAGGQSALPELAHNVPFYCNPADVASFANTILRALDEPPAQRANRISAGRRLVVEHTWERCARFVARAIQRALCPPHASLSHHPRSGISSKLFS